MVEDGDGDGDGDAGSDAEALRRRPDVIDDEPSFALGARRAGEVVRWRRAFRVRTGRGVYV